MNLTLGLGFFMMQRGQLAMSLNSIERLAEYSKLHAEPEGSEAPPESWPANGTVALQGVTAQYRPGLPNVLRDVSIEIKGGEKVGVCGRTGSGKSSLLLTLFRLIPLLGESKLLVDGVDTATMPLESLRSKLSAIPQEPVLFSGSVRENIDPFKRVDDDKMMLALEQCHLKDTILSKAKDGDCGENPLDLELGESSLSIGEKQLLCLARALARNQRILVLDEATSSVDPHTDKLIQETIRGAFAHCTVITVAHRLNTIMDCDRVLVLDAGRVAEFDSPSRLKNDPSTMFAQLVADAEREDE
jgi:ABC-type multidrug transport system fused ATPase/permease subunit